MLRHNQREVLSPGFWRLPVAGDVGIRKQASHCGRQQLGVLENQAAHARSIILKTPRPQVQVNRWFWRRQDQDLMAQARTWSGGFGAELTRPDTKRAAISAGIRAGPSPPSDRAVGENCSRIGKELIEHLIDQKVVENIRRDSLPARGASVGPANAVSWGKGSCLGHLLG